jgi:hypothetical protein
MPFVRLHQKTLHSPPIPLSVLGKRLITQGKTVATLQQDALDFFDVAGPFNIAASNRTCAAGQSEIWKAADEYDQGLSKAIGCYLFCLKHGESLKPWYVGMTVARSGFKGEVFQAHKLQIYNEILSQSTVKRPVLFLFPLWTSANRFSRAYASSRPKIAWLERTLMGMAYAQNPDLSNIRDMVKLRTIAVSGLLGPKQPGRQTSGVKQVRKALTG